MIHSKEIILLFYKYLFVPLIGLVLFGVIYAFNKEFFPYVFAVVWLVVILIYYIFLGWNAYWDRTNTKPVKGGYQNDCRVVFGILLVAGLIGSFISDWSFLLPSFALGLYCFWFSRRVQRDKKINSENMTGCFQRVYIVFAFIILPIFVVLPILSLFGKVGYRAETMSELTIMLFGFPAFLALPILSVLTCFALRAGGGQVKVMRTRSGHLRGYILLGLAVIMALLPWLSSFYRASQRMGHW